MDKRALFVATVSNILCDNQEIQRKCKRILAPTTQYDYMVT